MIEALLYSEADVSHYVIGSDFTRLIPDEGVDLPVVARCETVLVWAVSGSVEKSQFSAPFDCVDPPLKGELFLVCFAEEDFHFPSQVIERVNNP